MQLIFETQPTEGIKINMSTQAESSANEDFRDIKKNIVNPNSENNIDDETIANHEINLSNKTETDKTRSETIKESLLKEAKCLGNTNGNDNKKCNLGEIVTLKESDLIDNINKIVNENITNGTSNSLDGNDSRCENMNEKIVTENISTINKNVNPEIILPRSSVEDLESFSEKGVNYMLTNDQHSKLELSLSDDTTINQTGGVVPEESSQMSTADTDDKLQETESFSNGKEIMEVIHTTPIMKKESENVDTSENTVIIDEGTNCDQILSNDTSSTIGKKELVDIINNYQIVPGDNIVINEEITKLSEVSADITAMSNETVSLPDETIVENETLTTVSGKDPEDIKMDEETNQPSVPADTVMNDKTDTVLNKQSATMIDIEDSEALSMDDDKQKLSEVSEDFALNNVVETVSLKTNLETEKLVTMDVKPPEDVVMDDELDTHIDLNIKGNTLTNALSSENEDLATTNVTDSEAIVIDDDINLALNIKSDTSTNKPVIEQNKITASDCKNLDDTVKDEEIDKLEVLEDVAINNEINSPIDDTQLVDATMKEVTTGTENIEKQNLSLENTKEPTPIAVEHDKSEPTVQNALKCDEFVSAQIENSSPELKRSGLKDLPAMEETHDISMAEPTSSPINENIINNYTERVCEKSLESNFVSVKVNNDPVMSAPKTCEKIDDDIEVEHIPMEVDEIEIVDLDKENYVENISNTKTSSNIVVSDEINNVEIIEPELTAEKTVKKNVSNTEQGLTNKDVESNKTEASIITKNASVMAINANAQEFCKDDQEKVEILDEDDIKIVENKTNEIPAKIQVKENCLERKETKILPVVCKLSNTLDILSDDEDEPSKLEKTVADNIAADKLCINIDDDDDIMLIEEDSNSKDAINEDKTEVLNDKEAQAQPNNKIDLETGENNSITTDIMELSPKINEKDTSPLEIDPVPIVKNVTEEGSEKSDEKKTLLPQSFLKTAKKNLADMTRDELEDFCILRIVESIVDRTNLSDIKTKMKTMAQNLEDFRKRAMMLTKQNRDLQVVLKSVQEEQKKHTNAPIQPLKITRSVGMQVLMNEKIDTRRKGPIQCQPSNVPIGRPARALQKVMKAPGTPTPIPVPRKVPVNNSPAKALPTTPTNSNTKVANPNPNPGLRNPSPVQKVPEKRTHSRMQANSSVTVDLTDDEPPAKVNNKNSPIPPVRVVPPQSLLAQQRPQFTQPLNCPRKVYIPISGPQGQAIRPGQTLMMKNVPPSGPRPRVPPMPRMQQSPIRIAKPSNRHPAPLPDAMKQYTPPTWKSLPPAPDLKLSKVENGIVISWKIDGYPDGGYETIASYQLYAYQETTAPPCTALWKKIGDVKALPLPMACTLTQFMAGFKYYFAVRAVDVRSRLGPFSLPGSILLLNKV